MNNGILISTGSGSRFWTEPIKEWCERHNISSYTLEHIQGKTPFAINVNGDVNLCRYEDSELPEYIVFNEITGGNFIVSYSELSSMKGFPKKVGKNFDISFSKISSLDDVPQLVDKDFVACGCPFTKQEIEAKTKVTCNVYV